MLVLTRRYGEKIIIGTGEDRIEIHFLGKNHEFNARLGIKAPLHIPIMREELEGVWNRDISPTTTKGIK